MDEIVGNMGYVDALREVSREGDQYSWWPDNEQAEMLNLGWRFDYQLLTPEPTRPISWPRSTCRTGAPALICKRRFGS